MSIVVSLVIIARGVVGAVDLWFVILMISLSSSSQLVPHPHRAFAMTVKPVVLPAWTHRPAMVWDPTMLLRTETTTADQKRSGSSHTDETTTLSSSSSTAKCVYWKSQVWHSRTAAASTSGGDPTTTTTGSNSNDNNSHMTQQRPEPAELACVTYRDLFTTAAVTVVQLRKVLEERLMDKSTTAAADDDDDDDHDDTIIEEDSGIPIVVAIPEGPWLPLAVLVVHALNRPFETTTGTATGTATTTRRRRRLFAILVPLEPSEAMERNRRILQDIEPRLVLCVSDKDEISKDQDRLDRLVDSMNQTVNAESGNTRCGGGYNPCQVLNFATFVEEALTVQKASPTYMDEFYSKWVVEDKDGWSLQDLVAGAADFLLDAQQQQQQQPPKQSSTTTDENRISHIVYTSGTTGNPKGCVSSIQSLQHYLQVKNEVYSIQPSESSSTLSTVRVLLASALSFDPCLSDILATFHAKVPLALAPRSRLLNSLAQILQRLHITHVLCTPTLWGMVDILLPPPSNMTISSMADNSSSNNNNNNNNNNSNSHKDRAIPPRPSSSFPALRVVALGGEPIPKRIQQQWARSSSHAAHDNNDGDDHQSSSCCRLFATYGVTEACVYQTAGEIVWPEEDDRKTVSSSMGGGGGGRGGQNVGKPFRGLEIRICKEDNQESLDDVPSGETGEVVLSGAQLDAWTGYWKRPALALKFVREQHAISTNSEVGGDETVLTRYHYRTGDRGVLDPLDGSLRILGRIGGEEGMVKVNGVRIELGEIEAALVDDYMIRTVSVVVESCMVQVLQRNDDSSTRSEVYAYYALSEQALSELGLPAKKDLPRSGILITGGVLLTLLRARCANSLKAACMPNAFVLLPHLQLSPTGKRDPQGLPPISECTPIEEQDQDQGVLLKHHGRLGKFMAETICENLNLQKLQQEMMTTSVTLDMLGGDSLAATRIIRALYAYHHRVENSRYLGGDYGEFEGPFDVVHLLRAKSLGDYVDMLQRHNVGLHPEDDETRGDKKETEEETSSSPSSNDDDKEQDHSSSKAEKPPNALYDALVLATTQGQSSIAVALLQAGANPNHGDHGNRLGKVSGGFYHRKYAFHSSPLHLACKQGDSRLVQQLLAKGASYKSADAAGLFPLHLVASSIDTDVLESTSSSSHLREEEDARRLECVKSLFEAGAPIRMRDGNHQTVLHAAARSGHSSILRYVMTEWNESSQQKPQSRSNQLFVNWMDRWYRTPVHWAILNGRTEALRVLLELGCTSAPYKPSAGKRTSVAIEYPMELCNRLYPTIGTDENEDEDVDPVKREMGATMRRLLEDAIAREKAQRK